MSIIDKALSYKEIQDSPPVLIDIGASGKMYPKWKKIAKYSICIAFDADYRDFNLKKNQYKKIYTYNYIVQDKNIDEADFYLTRSPHCSSLLKPDIDSLQDWSYTSLFEVEKTEKVKTVMLPEILKKSGLDRIDWYKSDSQGIDLRLFKSLPDSVRDNTIVAEFEPGIMNAYKGEDKLHHLLAYMDEKKIFWTSEMVVKGSARIPENTFNTLFKGPKLRKLARFSMKESAGWTEITYINSFKRESVQTKRNYILGWVFSTIEDQHGFALTLAEDGMKKYNDSLFEELKAYSIKEIRQNIIKLRFYPAIISKIKQLLN